MTEFGKRMKPCNQLQQMLPKPALIATVQPVATGRIGKDIRFREFTTDCNEGRQKIYLFNLVQPVAKGLYTKRGSTVVPNTTIATGSSKSDQSRRSVKGRN
jgi:hypothetical protein